MALRAGYYGIKTAIKQKLEKLIKDMDGAKIIKTIGAGLNLSDQGELSAKIASDTQLGCIKVGENLSINEAGVLSATASGGSAALALDTEVDTGKTLDGKPVYAVLTTFFTGGTAGSHWSQTGNDWICDLIPAGTVDFMLECKAYTEASGTYSFNNPAISFVKSTSVFSLNFSITSEAYIYVEYTKATNNRKKGGKK